MLVRGRNSESDTAGGRRRYWVGRNKRVTWTLREIKKEKGGSAGVWPVLSDGEQ
jgi:hypothetical protein